MVNLEWLPLAFYALVRRRSVSAQDVVAARIAAVRYYDDGVGQGWHPLTFGQQGHGNPGIGTL